MTVHWVRAPHNAEAMGGAGWQIRQAFSRFVPRIRTRGINTVAAHRG
jgi:hypothetical protein